MSSNKMNEEYRKNCALAEKEALQLLQSVHMPVINMPAMRGISLASYRRQMNKCDAKVTEMDLVLVAVTDFVAAALTCPPLFGWNVEDNSEQVSAVLADLGRRWTRLLMTNQSRRVELLSLLESSLRCLGDQHARHFLGAKLVGHRPVEVAQVDVDPKEDSDPKDDSATVVDLDSEPDVEFKTNVTTKTVASPKVSVLGQTTPGSNCSWPRSPQVIPAPLPVRKLLTLHAFFPKRDAVASTKEVTSCNERKSPTAAVAFIGNDRPQVFAASQGQLIVYPTNHDNSSLGLPTPLPVLDVCAARTNEHGILPLVNSTNVDKPKTSAGGCKPVTNVLQAMMIAAKENKRKRTDACQLGLNKLARKGC